MPLLVRAGHVAGAIWGAGWREIMRLGSLGLFINRVNAQISGENAKGYQGKRENNR